jgi:hypothetical protein
LRKTGFDGRAGKNFDWFIFAFFNSIDPTETLAAKFAVMHNAVFPGTAW